MESRNRVVSARLRVSGIEWGPRWRGGWSATIGDMDPARPDRLFRTLAAAETVTWTLLLLGMGGKYVLELGDAGVRIGGSLHGFVFLAYCLLTLVVAIDARWSAPLLVTGWASAVLPYATIPFERYVERRGLLADRWRLRTQPPERVVELPAGWALRFPAPAVLLALVGVAVVFAGLLALGPPTSWLD